MSSSSSHPLDAGMRHHAYSRKQKSLGLLCANLYNRDGIDSIGLDDAARRLGVERRRIYDIVNIMESVGEDLEDELDESPEQYADEGDEKPSQIINSSSLSSGACCKARSGVCFTMENEKEENALCFLIFLVVIWALQTQVEARKPAFRWLGLKDGKVKADNNVKVVAPGPKKLTKRAFGTEITNVNSKKSRPNLPADKKPMKVQMKSEDLNECNRVAMKQLGSKSGYAFGPFHPNGVMKRGADVEVKCGKGVRDWDSLAASFRPHLTHNNLFLVALSELFAHYVEAWKTWYVEATKGSRNLQQHLSKLVTSDLL
ncbi:hypothetical protein GW17_00035491 [Ensete ventricosum]|nr:hypothetical protein GW17_00035491 [Ensete ventricosum]